MNVYFDESGDLGFTFNKRYGQGGSSRYLTIAFLLVPKTLSPLPKRIVKDLYAKKGQSPKYELKGTNLTFSEKVYFANQAKKLLIDNPEIKLFAITVKKTRVQPHIRQDPNKLYNYMTSLVLPDRIKRYPNITLIADERSIKVKSGNSLRDYLQIMLWFPLKAKTTLQYTPLESFRALNLQFIDYVANIVWSRYERNHDAAYNILRPKMKSVTLFFS